MNRTLAIGLAVVALSAALSLKAIGGNEQKQVADAKVSVTPYYVRGPRIIHVPQPGDEIVERGDVQANVDRRDEAALPDDGDRVVAPPRHRTPAPKHRSVRRTPKIKARTAKVSVTKPHVRTVSRATLRSEAPPPPPPAPLGPRRAVLSAPPPRAEGLSPIYPTPRFDAKATAAEKFERPSQTEAAAIPPPAVTAPPLTEPAMTVPPIAAPPLSNELPAATEN